MKFSIIHASARPEEWEKSFSAYYINASGKHEIEYILVKEPTAIWPEWFIGDSTGFCAIEGSSPKDFGDYISYHGLTPKSSVSHWNLGASKATGDIIILNSDDMFPPKDWDEKLAQKFENAEGSVIRVGYTQEHQKGLITLQIMSKYYYNQIGYAMYPGYQSVYADNDFTACAEELEAVIEAPEIVWEHRHPSYSGKELDEVYQTENEPLRYAYGRQLFEFRKKLGYKFILGLEAPKKLVAATDQKIIALCTPGRTFDSDFLFEFGQIAIKTFCGGGFIHAPSKSCNIYTARSECLMAIDTVGIKPDYLFWVDSDQLEYLSAYQQLFKTMEENPNIDILAGWTYMQHNQNINAGYFYNDLEGNLEILSDGTFKTENLKYPKSDRAKFIGRMVEPEEMEGKPFKVDWIGFGAVLMRSSVIEKLAPDIFSPIYIYKGKNHWVAEDTGFCLRALEKGIDIYLDPLAYVKHMKLQEVLPAKTLNAGVN